MKKIKKAFVETDMLIAIMFISVVLYFAYTTATGAINKRYQIEKRKEAMMVAENIMNRTLSKGVYSLVSEPVTADIDDTAFLPVEASLFASYVSVNSGISYQIKVEKNYIDSVLTDNLKKITVTVHYPIRVVKYDSSKETSDKAKEAVRDKISLEEEKDASGNIDYRTVQLITYKAAEQYIKSE